jgi:hypothetical protein
MKKSLYGCPRTIFHPSADRLTDITRRRLVSFIRAFLEPIDPRQRASIRFSLSVGKQDETNTLLSNN